MTDYIFDIETDGLKPTRIHCLCYGDSEGNIVSLTNYRKMKEFVERKDIRLIGHNIMKYDIPVLRRLLSAEVTCDLIDTLAISYVVEPSRKLHGLESYGNDFGIPKPVVTDWESLKAEDYIHRCTEDVKINTRLWNGQIGYLRRVYESNPEDLTRFLHYLTFKMDCVREQEEIGFKLDIPHCKKMLETLSKERDQKVIDLEEVMPKVPVYVKKTLPKTLKKKDGSFSVAGETWFGMLEAQGLPADTVTEVKVIKGYEEPNARSHSQVKAWLYSLGWVPEHWKQVRNKKTGEVKEVEQVASKEGGGEICNSIKKLYDKEPKLEILNGLSILNHRISIFEAFLEDGASGRIYAGSAGLTNTLRLQHAVIVNLPGVGKKYGKEIRSAIVADEGCELAGCDLSGIEDSTKRHFIWKYDPEYVEIMNAYGFDPHLDIGLLAGMFTQEEVDFFKEIEEKKKQDSNYKLTPEEKARYNPLKVTRTKAKIVNFSATYKVGATTLSKNSGMSMKESRKLLDIYWKRNKAILDVENSLTVQMIDGQKWQLNPVSKFWYTLRSEKDRFSTLNQGTAAYVFDMWIQYLRAQGIKIGLQYHDEVLFNFKVEDKPKVVEMVDKAINWTNDYLKLNITVACSKDFGINYAECH